MCIICCKPKNVEMPTKEEIQNMWYNNSDGCGIMYTDKNRVYIEKGFMTIGAFEDRLKKLKKQVDLKKSAVIMHFRITTHGGTKQSNCHPFPITDDIELLKSLKIEAKLGVAHNGIINSVTPRKGISDTMEYIATQLAPLSKAVPDFYTNENLRKMIENATESKLAFMTAKGAIYRIGKFEEHNGCFYSNKTYSYKKFNIKDLYKDDESYYDSIYTEGYYGGYNRNGYPRYEQTMINWIDEMSGEYIKMRNGECFIGDYFIDKDENVYEMDWEACCGTRINATAYRPSGDPKHFREDEAWIDFVPVLPA